MRKGKKTANGKPRKLVRKSSAKARSPEWEILEERYSGMSADFSKLAGMMAPKDE